MSEHTSKEYPNENGNEAGPNDASAASDGDAAAADAISDETQPGADVHSAQTFEQLSEELHKTRDQLLRKIAEFENFRRRTREEQIQLVQYGNEGLILELIPVLDDFDRSLSAGREHSDFDSFYKGVEILRNKFAGILERRGLKPIVATGQPFDEAFHEALMQMPGTGKEPGVVIDEVEKGYLLNDKVIRHAKVTVAAEE